jgi:hypothetical protein
LFKRFKRSAAVRRLLEEKLYEKVVLELSQGVRREGLWAKAIANCNGQDEKAKALYIQYRVQSIRDEKEIVEALTKEAESQTKTGTNEFIDSNVVENKLMPITTCRKCNKKFRMHEDTSHTNPICPACLNK